MTEPCECDKPNAECRRAGMSMTARLHALCQGSEFFRRLWDEQANLSGTPASRATRAAHKIQLQQTEALPSNPGRHSRDHSLVTPRAILPFEDCVHLGQILETTKAPDEPCTSEKAWLRVCSIHGTCTLDWVRRDARMVCSGCRDFKSRFAADGKRHLLYHVYPVSGNGTWQRNCDEILKRRPLFNGVRIVAIATDQRTDSANMVKKYLGDLFHYLSFTNNPRRREVVSFVPLMETLAPHVRDGDAIFYAHAKGVSRAYNPGETHPHWANILYETSLDYWPFVARQLAAFPIVGSLKKTGSAFGTRVHWHYSGSFWWMRSDVYKRNWRNLPDFVYGVEAWPGSVFSAEEAGVIFHEGATGGWQHGGLDMYTFEYLRPVIFPALEEWRKDHAHDRIPEAVR